ncbi:hypothetical protein D0T56_15755 [Dysgonomonas sp. 520]|nr:hypothetical protein [Dysgonomonas sp. 520]
MNSEKKVNFKVVWGGIMSVVYICIAAIVGFTPWIFRYNDMNDRSMGDNFLPIRIILGASLFLYGLFRAYRAIKGKP